VFSVRYNVVHGEAVVDADDRVLEVRERIKMPPESNGMFGGEDRMGRVGFHYANKCINNL